MPLHDWTRTDAGDWHHFHQSWSSELSRHLNQPGKMPKGYYAYIESKVAGSEPDVVAVQARRRTDDWPGGTATLEAPRTQVVSRLESDNHSYARRANRISIRHRHGDVVAIIELVSPGNKDTDNSLAAFVNKVVDFLRKGVHVAVIDLFPPTVRDPNGIHQAITDKIVSIPYEAPEGKDRVLVGYCADEPIVAYIEPLGVGDEFRPVPLFLSHDVYVWLPLQQTYDATWQLTPEPIREILEPAL